MKETELKQLLHKNNLDPNLLSVDRNRTIADEEYHLAVLKY